MPQLSGSAATALSSRSPIRSSVISQRRGRGWLASMAVPIAAAMSDASDRLNEVRDRISRAAALAQRRPDAVTLVAVSKTHDEAAIRPLLEAGQRVFGENRVQEAQAKWPMLREDYAGVQLHLIGQLQSNKAEEAVALFDAIHSVDRPSLVAALGKAIEKSGRRPDCFLQVNLAEEPQKGGCAPGDLPALIDAARHAGLPVAGLMCIPPEIGR